MHCAEQLELFAPVVHRGFPPLNDIDGWAYKPTMRLKAQVVSVQEHSFVGKKGKVIQFIASCLEIDPEYSFVNTFDYILPEGLNLEQARKAFYGKQVTLGVTNARLNPATGRFRFEGSLLETK